MWAILGTIDVILIYASDNAACNIRIHTIHDASWVYSCIVYIIIKFASWLNFLCYFQMLPIFDGTFKRKNWSETTTWIAWNKF